MGSSRICRNCAQKLLRTEARARDAVLIAVNDETASVNVFVMSTQLSLHAGARSLDLRYRTRGLDTVVNTGQTSEGVS